MPSLGPTPSLLNLNFAVEQFPLNGDSGSQHGCHMSGKVEAYGILEGPSAALWKQWAEAVDRDSDQLSPRSRGPVELST